MRSPRVPTEQRASFTISRQLFPFRPMSTDGPLHSGEVTNSKAHAGKRKQPRLPRGAEVREKAKGEAAWDGSSSQPGSGSRVMCDYISLLFLLRNGRRASVWSAVKSLPSEPKVTKDMSPKATRVPPGEF